MLTRLLNQVAKHDQGRMLASLTFYTKDLALAEDCLQEAFISALDHWSKNGVPDKPEAWLMRTAQRKAIDHFRRQQTQQKNVHLIEQLIKQENSNFDPSDLDRFPDKRLELIFTTCHPALDEKSRLALTLKTIAGFSNEEIASAFLDKPTTIAQRIVRAKKKIKLAGIPYSIPASKKLPERIQSVLSVIYLIFNQGYVASHHTEYMRADLNKEAIELARLVYELLPSECEVAGLLALMLLHDSRKVARQNEHGELVTLEHQDRKLWDRKQIKKADTLLRKTLQKGRVGNYQIQAAISAIHCLAETWRTTDWNEICTFYSLLTRINDTPVITVNYATALLYADKINFAEKMLDELSNTKDIASYVPYYLAKAKLAEFKGDTTSQKEELSKAFIHSKNQTEMRFIKKQIELL